jgi:folate-binding protein YgfZ
MPAGRGEKTVNQTWQAFLRNQGAVLQDGRVQHFGDPARERRAAAAGEVLVALCGIALIRAHGAEAQNFLNGQLSNDVRRLDATHSQLAAWCSPQGRILAVLRLFRRGEEYLLQLPAALRESLLQRLRRFVLRAKVTLDNADDLVSVGLCGPQAQTLLHEAAGFTPEEGADACETRGEVSLLRLPGPHPRFEIIAPAAAAMNLWDRLKRRATPAAFPVWAWLDIMAGIPNIYPETQEAFVPQMANLELLGGINFKKGCYPGQEIVARMQYLGRLKQRMYRVHVETPQPPRPGTPIYAPDLPGQAAGTVVDAQPAPEGGCDLLAVIHLSSVTQGTLWLGSESGPRLSLQSLPYSLPAAAAE